MMDRSFFRAVAVLLAAQLGAGCTINNYSNVEQNPPASSGDIPVAARCHLDWQGAIPAGWTVARAQDLMAEIPQECGRAELLVHEAGTGKPDWENGTETPRTDYLVRSTVVERRRLDIGALTRIHLFTGPAPSGDCEPSGAEGEACPSAMTRLVVLQGPQGPEGKEGEKGGVGPIGPPGIGTQGLPGKDGKDGEDGEDGEDGLPGDAGKAGREGAPGTPGSTKITELLAPAAAGGGIVYALMYLNLLSAPGARFERAARLARDSESEPAEEEMLPAAAAAARGDPRVRIGSAGFAEDSG